MESSPSVPQSVSTFRLLPARNPLISTARNTISAITTTPKTNCSLPDAVGAWVAVEVAEAVGLGVKVPRGVGVDRVAVTVDVDEGRVAVGERVEVGVFPG